MRVFLILFLLLALANCAEEKAQPDTLSLEPVAFDDLPGWASDKQSEALPALALSCVKLDAKSAWQNICAALPQVPAHNDQAARAFFERYFQPYLASGNNGESGLFTGYYEAQLRGSLTPTGQYRIPLYARPGDLITADLGLFKPEWKGQKITGKVKETTFIPYDERAEIAKNSLASRAQVLLWVDDSITAFFLEIQGSGRVVLPDGQTVRVGYDGANGRAYVAIGKALADMGELQKPVTMQMIRAWLAAHADRAQEIMNLNPSYVFFRRLDGDGPIGAEGVVLTPLRSLAVDRNFVSLGTPVWLTTEDGLQRLLIAQDTGGAIKGTVRGDMFWGMGEEAEQKAGAMQSQGHYYLLMPKTDAAAHD